jgi:hypothetical protein
MIINHIPSHHTTKLTHIIEHRYEGDISSRVTKVLKRLSHDTESNGCARHGGHAATRRELHESGVISLHFEIGGHLIENIVIGDACVLRSWDTYQDEEG